jgi:hypothetical protein
MKSPDREEPDPDPLLSNYKPLALKAVLAGCAVKRETTKMRSQQPESFGPLPEGFHMPQPLDD